jgi:uncharacterized membrane protein YfcA
MDAMMVLPPIVAGLASLVSGLTSFGDAIMFHVMFAIARAAGLVTESGRASLTRAVVYVTVMSVGNMPLQVFFARKDLLRCHPYGLTMVCAGVTMVPVGASLLFAADLGVLTLLVGIFFCLFAASRLSVTVVEAALARTRRGDSKTAGDRTSEEPRVGLDDTNAAVAFAAGAGASAVAANVAERGAGPSPRSQVEAEMEAELAAAAAAAVAPAESVRPAVSPGRDTQIELVVQSPSTHMPRADASTAALEHAGAGMLLNHEGDGGSSVHLTPLSPEPHTRAAAAPSAQVALAPPPGNDASARHTAASAAAAEDAAAIAAARASVRTWRDAWRVSISPLHRVRRTLFTLFFAGFASGLLNGLLGTGGPPQMIAYSLLRVDKDAIRGTGTVYGMVEIFVRITVFATAASTPFDMENEWGVYLAIIGCSWLGFLLGTWARRFTDSDAILRLLLAIVYLSSLILLGGLKDGVVAGGFAAATAVWLAALGATYYFRRIAVPCLMRGRWRGVLT